MDLYIARQPILTASKRLYAYELLYRGYPGGELENVSGNQATSSVLSGAFWTEGMEKISGGKPCFVNFTEELLLEKIAYSFSQDKIIVEILEDVSPTKAILSAVRELKAAGYIVALDDFVFDRRVEPFIALADIIKIDVRLTPMEAIRETLKNFTGYQGKLLAEKVETKEEFDKGLELGFHYFQGYFFSKPEKMLVKEIPVNKMTLFALMTEISRKTTSLDRLHQIVSRDLAISYKLLRFLNSAYFYRLEKVKSVKHAIAYLGEKELRRFLLLVTVSQLAEDKPLELVRLSLLRAKFCELLGRNSRLAEHELELFLLGLLSLVDSMLDARMETVMEKLSVSDNVKNALVYKHGIFAPFLAAMFAYERGQADLFAEIMKDLQVDLALVPDMYVEAVKYSNGLS